MTRSRINTGLSVADGRDEDDPRAESLVERRPIAYDCRYFLGDRPCRWHKSEGALCFCDHYEPVSKRILMIKLDAIGDVLRTTCLLPTLSDTYPGASIVWLTRPEAAPLLEHNPYIDEIITYGPDATLMLATRAWDLVINLDAAKTSAALAAMARAPDRVGFSLDPKGFIEPTNPAAEDWLRMGLFDDLKKANTRTYQDMMCDILGVDRNALRYVFHVTDDECDQARKQLGSLGVRSGVPVIGINTGGGGRWTLKQWREEGFVELIGELHREAGAENLQILLLGGPAEKALNSRIAAAAPGPVVNTGSDNELRRFAALVSFCDVVVTGDTLALHIALAVDRRVVALFGPTSAAEIDLFDRGRKVFPKMECLCCYKPRCDFQPNCMDLIGARMICDAVMGELTLAKQSS